MAGALDVDRDGTVDFVEFVELFEGQNLVDYSGGRSPRKQKGGGGRGDLTTTELYRMPPLFCRDIYEAPRLKRLQAVP